MNRQKQSRRNFLRHSGSVFSGSWLSVNLPLIAAAAQTACSKQESVEAWSVLSAAEAAGLGAVADRIIPPDESPGAVETGVVYFIDTALGGFMAGQLGILQEGLHSLDTQAAAVRAGAGSFAELDFDQQTMLLEAVEDTPFFQAMINLTLIGMFAMPEYGGNRGGAGWKLLGFDHRHTWQPPFGYYDARHSSAGDDHDRS